MAKQKALECGSGKSKVGQSTTMSLYLSGKLKRQRHGFEYAALEIKNYLEGLILSDVVSAIMIMLVFKSFFFSLFFIFLRYFKSFSVS